MLSSLLSHNGYLTVLSFLWLIYSPFTACCRGKFLLEENKFSDLLFEDTPKTQSFEDAQYTLPFFTIGMI